MPGFPPLHRELIHLARLVDRDMFMRFRGGGVGHMYMREIEPWLDGTGWGAMWPSLGERDPDPSPPDTTTARPILPVQASQGDDENMDSSDGDSSSDESDDDGDGEDPEQPEVDDADSDEDENGGGKAGDHTEDGGDGEGTEDESEEYQLGFTSL